MASTPLVRAAVQGLFAGLAAASASACGGSSANAKAVEVPVEEVKPTPIATVASPPSKVEPIVTKPPPERDHDCCKGKNACKGQSGCATSFNDCAGMNECKGKGSACPPGQTDHD